MVTDELTKADISELGYSDGPSIDIALSEGLAAIEKGMPKEIVLSIIQALPVKYKDFLDDAQFCKTASYWRDLAEQQEEIKKTEKE